MNSRATPPANTKSKSRVFRPPRRIDASSAQRSSRDDLSAVSAVYEAEQVRPPSSASLMDARSRGISVFRIHIHAQRVLLMLIARYQWIAIKAVDW